MLTNIISEWKASKLGITLLVTGYIIGILVLSIGISIVHEANENYLDSFSGNPKDNLVVNLSTHNSAVFSFNNVSPIVNKCIKDVEIQILNIEGSIVQVDSCGGIVPIIYSKKAEWQIPLISGRHFTPKESMSSEHIAVVGKELAEKIFQGKLDSDSIIKIGEQNFKVIGIVGRTQRATQWDSIVYIPFKSLPDVIEDRNDNQLTLLLKRNIGDPFKTAQDIESYFKKIDSGVLSNYAYNLYEQKYNNQIWSNSLAVMVISGTILLIAVINVSNLSLFWILDRRREIAIRKAVGATDKVIVKGIIAELVLIALLSSTIAILIQSILHILLQKFLPNIGIYIKISLLNIAISSLVSVLCGLVTSIIPVRSMLKMETIEALRID